MITKKRKYTYYNLEKVIYQIWEILRVIHPSKIAMSKIKSIRQEKDLFNNYNFFFRHIDSQN